MSTWLVGQASSPGDFGSVSNYTWQHKIFYNNGRWWLFYSSDESHVGFVTSPDGGAWSAFTSLVAVANEVGQCIAVAYDIAANKFHITYVKGSVVLGNSVYYRRGTPNSDGTMTLDAEERRHYAVYRQGIIRTHWLGVPDWRRGDRRGGRLRHIRHDFKTIFIGDGYQ